MKTFARIALSLFFPFLPVSASDLRAAGCYICKGGGYVRYLGNDTFDKRKKAEKIGCKVTGTVGGCSNAKGTVK